MARSEEEILSGELILRLGGQDKRVQELSIKRAREWQAELGQKLVGLDASDLNGTADLSKVMDTVGDGMLELVLAYDRKGSLDREWVEENASRRELYDAFRKMLEATFPFVRDLQGAIGLLSGLASSGASAQASSTNGRSPTGASTLEPSRSG